MSKLEDDIDFSENVSSFKSCDISSSENEENGMNSTNKNLTRDNKSKAQNFYKKPTPNFGSSKLTKRKMKIIETEKLYKRYGPHSIFLYKPGVSLPDLSDYINNIIEVCNKNFLSQLLKFF